MKTWQDLNLIVIVITESASVISCTVQCTCVQQDHIGIGNCLVSACILLNSREDDDRITWSDIWCTGDQTESGSSVISLHSKLQGELSRARQHVAHQSCIQLLTHYTTLEAVTSVNKQCWLLIVVGKRVFDMMDKGWPVCHLLISSLSTLLVTTLVFTDKIERNPENC